MDCYSTISLFHIGDITWYPSNGDLNFSTINSTIWTSSYTDAINAYVYNGNSCSAGYWTTSSDFGKIAKQRPAPF